MGEDTREIFAEGVARDLDAGEITKRRIDPDIDKLMATLRERLATRVSKALKSEG